MKLQVSDLNSFYGPAHILFDIALEVGEGEVVALLGRNGAGKSTTFRSIVGLVENRSGRIVFEGKDVSREPHLAITATANAAQQFQVWNGRNVARLLCRPRFSRQNFVKAGADPVGST